jgi:hypothetical protein
MDDSEGPAVSDMEVSDDHHGSRMNAGNSEQGEETTTTTTYSAATAASASSTVCGYSNRSNISSLAWRFGTDSSSSIFQNPAADDHAPLLRDLATQLTYQAIGMDCMCCDDDGWPDVAAGYVWGDAELAQLLRALPRLEELQLIFASQLWRHALRVVARARCRR